MVLIVSFDKKMASRRLNRVNTISKEDCTKLGYHEIFICKDVLCKNILELMNINNSYEKSKQLLKIISEIVTPSPIRALQLLQRKHQSFLPTHLPPLDHALHGGLPSGTITEVTGPPGCGKTQLCLMTASLTAIDQLKTDNGSVVYIDTENAFTAKRFIEITSHKLHRKQQYNGIHPTDVAGKVIVFLESSIGSLMERLKNLEETIIGQNVKLVIVDSIASLARKEFGHQALLVERNNILMKEATMLKYYAETFNIPVLVTNQITTSFNSEFCGDSSLIAALGNTWAHAVNTRLMVRFSGQHVKELIVAKSPLCPATSIHYKVATEGIVPVDEM